MAKNARFGKGRKGRATGFLFIPPDGLYVSQSGSNSAAGTYDAPWRTLTYALTQMSAGMTVYLRAGTYDEGLSTCPSGTSWGNKVRIAAYPGETVWLTPAAHGVGNPGGVVRFQDTNVSYVEFDGINMDGSNMGYGTAQFVVDAGGEQHHIRIQNAEIVVRSTDNSAWSFGGSNGIEIHGGKPTMIGGFEFINLVIHGGGRPGTLYNDAGYGIYLATPNSLIEGCDISDGKGAGIHVYNDDGNDANSNVIRNNIIRDITRNSNVGQLWGILVSGGASNNQIYNNIIYNVNAEPGTSADGKGISIGSGSGNKVWNNTIVSNEGYGIFIDSVASSAVVQNNILYNNGTNYSNGAGASTTEDHNLRDGTDPLFTNMGANDYTLQSGSAARNTGATIAEVPTDIAGTARPQGGTYDMGAYERA